MTRNVVVISAGLSQPSSTRLLADQLAAATRSAVGGRGESVDIEFIELRELAVEMAESMVSGGRPTPALSAAQRQVAAADGIIAVTPVFTASYSGLFKTFVDLLDKDALTGKAVLVAATAGTPRHSLVLEHAMRPLFAYLRAIVVPTAVFAATEDFGGENDLDTRVHRAAAELAGLVVADRAGVAGFAQGDDEPGPLGPVTDFSELLRGHDGG
ncbi:FMN reductase [Janibacter limosus]|uniref:Oxidoreductase n=1 Tax=Janibacter limosus TaxID=53458 RepID=A0A4P6MWL5_9MICO|nr:FMN reductase [Janibacter limosus]QBF47419.1 oxidoreductase [Janibacter limosus]